MWIAQASRVMVIGQTADRWTDKQNKDTVVLCKLDHGQKLLSFLWDGLVLQTNGQRWSCR